MDITTIHSREFGLLYRIRRKYKRDGFRKLVGTGYGHAKRAFMHKAFTSFPSLTSIYKPQIEHALIELTNKCNLNCVMCFMDTRKQGFMSWELFKKVIDELDEMHVPVVSLSYAGESLLHPLFADFLSYAMSKRFKFVDWFDNGMLFNEEISKLVVEKGLTHITFSMDALGELNDKIRQGSKYDTIEKNILNLIHVRGENKKPRISINMTNIQQGKDEILKVVNRWVDKVDYLTLNPCITNKIQINVPLQYTETNPMCDSPFTYLSIMWNGDVVPCCHDLDGEMVMGNLETKSIKQIWQNSKYRQTRKHCATSRFPPNTLCHKCNVWKPKMKRLITEHEKFTETEEGVCTTFKKKEETG